MKSLLPLLLILVLALGCTQQRALEDQRTTEQEQADASKDRQDSRQTGEKIGEQAREASEKIRQESKELAQEASAAAEGIKEGWRKGDTKAGNAINVNSASADQLQKHLGVTAAEADQIILNRPYADKRDLLDRKVLAPERYNEVVAKIVVK